MYFDQTIGSGLFDLDLARSRIDESFELLPFDIHALEFGSQAGDLDALRFLGCRDMAE